MKRMKCIVVVAMAVAVMGALLAQTTVMQKQTREEFWKQRELKAPEKVKLALAAMRQKIQQKGLRYTVGYTKAMEKPRHLLFGDVDDPKITPAVRVEFNKKAIQLMKLDEETRIAALKVNPTLRARMPEFRLPPCSATQRAFNWRDLGKVTPVKEQTCGNCWAFAAIGAYEASYLRRNAVALDTSEQYINDCGLTDDGTDSGSCSGGLAVKAFQHMTREGNVGETVDPYTGTNQACTNPATPFDAVTWAYVDPAVDFPTTQQIKEAICAHGPVATRMRVVSDDFVAYTGLVYNEFVASDDLGQGHAVVLVGWDDDKGAWLMKNSWGTDWGEDGYCWIAYGSNRIGRHTSWIQAASRFYVIPLDRLKLLRTPILPKK